MRTIFTGIFMFLLFIVGGAMSIIFTFFSQVYLVVIVGFIFLGRFVPDKYKFYYWWNFGLSSSLLWLSIFFSKRALPETINWFQCSVAGFPFRVFTFPCPPMSGDYVPIEMWPRFYLSYIFWIAASVPLVLLISKTKFFNNKKVINIMLLLCLLINLWSLGMILFAFD